MLRPALSRHAEKFVRGRVGKHATQIALKIKALCQDPEPPDSQLLKGDSEGFRRADIGEYRIIYRVDGDILQVPLIGKRNDDEVYQRYRRKRK